MFIAAAGSKSIYPQSGFNEAISHLSGLTEHNGIIDCLAAVFAPWVGAVARKSPAARRWGFMEVGYDRG
jgi:hypothetical protein